jgi:hypothetical protein
MKMETMLLPTGEFLLVASEVDPMAPQGQFLDAFTHLKDSAGAAGCFITTQDVDVVDASYDQHAVRRDPPPAEDDDDKWWEDAPTDPQPPSGSMFIAPINAGLPAGYKDLGMMDATEARKFFQFDSEGDQAVIDAVNRGRTFGPAGLVKGRPGDPDFLRDPSFVRGGTPGVDPEPEGVLVVDESWEAPSNALELFKGVLTQDVREMALSLHVPPRLFNVAGDGTALEGPPAPPRAPQIGDRVRITAAAPNHLSETPIGVEGEVIHSGGYEVPGEVYVEFWHPRCSDYTYRWFFPQANVEVLNG